MARASASARDGAGDCSGGASFAYVFGWVLVFLLAVEAVTGVALAAFYSPSTTDAWASVAYVQDQMRAAAGSCAASTITAASRDRDRRRAPPAADRGRRRVQASRASSCGGSASCCSLLVLAFAITGYVLRWDQAGYWANQVEIGIAAGTPVVGGAIRKLAIGGNEYGNLTLTRFYALHVVVLPAIVTRSRSRTSCSRAAIGVTPRVARRRACRAGRSRRCATRSRWRSCSRSCSRYVVGAARRRSRGARRSVGGVRRAAALVLPLAVRAAHARRLAPSRSSRWSRRRSSAASSSRCRSSIAARPSSSAHAVDRRRSSGCSRVIGALTIDVVRRRRQRRRRSRSASTQAEQVARPRARARREVRRAGDRAARRLLDDRRCIARATLYAQRCEGCHDARQQGPQGPDHRARSRQSRVARGLPQGAERRRVLGPHEAREDRRRDEAGRARRPPSSTISSRCSTRRVGRDRRRRGEARSRQDDLRQGVHRLPQRSTRASPAARRPGSAGWAAATGTRASSATRSRRSTWAPTRARCRGSTRSCRSPTATRSPSISVWLRTRDRSATCRRLLGTPL